MQCFVLFYSDNEQQTTVPALARNLHKLHRSLSVDLANQERPISPDFLPSSYDEGFLGSPPASARIDSIRLQSAFLIQRQIQEEIYASAAQPYKTTDALSSGVTSSTSPCSLPKNQQRDVEQDDTITSSTSLDPNFVTSRHRSGSSDHSPFPSTTSPCTEPETKIIDVLIKGQTSLTEKSVDAFLKSPFHSNEVKNVDVLLRTSSTAIGKNVGALAKGQILTDSRSTDLSSKMPSSATDIKNSDILARVLPLHSDSRSSDVQVKVSHTSREAKGAHAVGKASSQTLEVKSVDLLLKGSYPSKETTSADAAGKASPQALEGRSIDMLMKGSSSWVSSSVLKNTKESHVRNRLLYAPPLDVPEYKPTRLYEQPAKRAKLDDGYYPKRSASSDKVVSPLCSGLKEKSSTLEVSSPVSTNFLHGRLGRTLPMPVVDSSTDDQKPVATGSENIDTADDMKNFLNSVLERKPSVKPPRQVLLFLTAVGSSPQILVAFFKNVLECLFF